MKKYIFFCLWISMKRGSTYLQPAFRRGILKRSNGSSGPSISRKTTFKNEDTDKGEPAGTVFNTIGTVQNCNGIQLNLVSCLPKSDLERLLSIDILPSAAGLQHLFEEGAFLPEELSLGLMKTLSSNSKASISAGPSSSKSISRRLSSFIGGRVALRRAIASVSTHFNSSKIIEMEPIINSEGGAPLLPQGIQGSISHKDDIAVGVALQLLPTCPTETTETLHPSKSVGVGVDLERCRPSSASWRLLRRLLTDREREHQLRVHKQQGEEVIEDDEDQQALTKGF